MKTSFVALTFIAGALAAPATSPNVLDNRQAALLCGTGSPQCCDVNVLGVADLNCQNPPALATTIPEFNDICAAIGKINMCCILPILGQALLCTSPDGST